MMNTGHWQKAMTVCPLTWNQIIMILNCVSLLHLNINNNCEAQTIVSQSPINSAQLAPVRSMKIVGLTSDEQNSFTQNNTHLSNNNITNNFNLHPEIISQTQADLANQLTPTSTSTSINQQATSANGYKMMLKSYDKSQDVLYVDLIPVEPTNIHEPRIELRSQFQVGPKYPFVTVDEQASNDTFVAAVLASDADSGPRGEVDVSIESGNELHDFKLIKLATTTNSYSILVNGAPLSRDRCQEYNLNIVAKDRGQPPKSSSLGLIVRVNATQSSSPWNIDPWSSSQGSNEPSTELIYIALKLVTLFVTLVLVIMFGFALRYKR